MILFIEDHSYIESLFDDREDDHCEIKSFWSTDTAVDDYETFESFCISHSDFDFTSTVRYMSHLMISGCIREDQTPPLKEYRVRRFVCKLKYLFKSFPTDHLVEKNEIVELAGYIIGKDPVVKLDTVKHPSSYKHLDCCMGVLSNKELKKHFKEVL